jgi:hypothetical protein
MNPEFRDPNSLRRHPLHKAHVPAPDKKSEQWKAFADTVHADGRVLVPLLITKDGFVMDGWWKREAASDFQFEKVPCFIQESDAAARLIVESLIGGKTMSVGAKVYIALGLLSEYAESAEHRRQRNIIAGRKTAEERIKPEEVFSTKQAAASLRYLAKRFGCCPSTVLKARDIRAILHDPKTFTAWLKQLEVKRADPEQLQAELRDRVEPQLFNGSKSLWDVLQAEAGRLTGARKDRQEEQLDFFTDPFASWGKHFEKLNQEGRKHLAKRLAHEFANLPADCFEIVDAAIGKAREIKGRTEA